ncbi:thiolase family protein [Corynebacterium minutissimum]|uniref:Probable acetyl-CoA acetyltransferase n=1 Tax=Corynebacterium minutissimum TaxID=38301 RepID=A0A2X4R7W2_9CORY|nr:acetyl-CoA C-acyltransferase [Corynebacterium minutissimum]KHO30365.1 beta-ketoadipyl CoA thiolase [Corynebacterium minutissimum]QPS59912.1 acetyl-CoA C-acyltransferase [Corynebacterium minutissimum]QQA79297.1 acetyl-CoA C-acyltransferase [Corynebacterium minutissimum]SQH98186.1 beta-ketoadipyl CoA thiolase [Corynebacterium minutissimum]VEG04645.1 beta-ketoadipyl CoA thiolase [Corynebacterium minutissimum]
MTAYLVSGFRTPVGRYGGALSSVRPDDLMATAIKKTVEEAGLDPSAVDEVIIGNANGAGEENRNVARMSWLLAGYPDTVPGITVNRLCASGMSSIALATALVESGQADIVVAGGVESMSRAPWVMEKPNKPFAKPGQVFDTSIGWRFANPKFAEQEKMTYSMPETAEEVANVFGISREEADAFAVRSQERALVAIEAGKFAREIVPVEVTDRKGNVTVVDTDEGPRPGTTMEVLAKLRPVTSLGDVTTAGNASSLNDGASCVIVASDEALKKHNLTARARVVVNSARGVRPDIMGTGPIPATRDVLERAGWELDSVDAVELNEAFASQSIACIRELGLDEDKVNAWGGAIALGHPLGSSGSRITLTLLNRLETDGLSRGIATMCVGVGQGTAIAIERV